MNQLISRVGRTKVPADISKRNLGINGNVDTIYEIINDQIAEMLKIRNGGIKNIKKQISYRQLFNFFYNDGTPMLTIGGVIFRNEQEYSFKSAQFDKLYFTRTGKSPFKIEVPKLTFKEIFSLDELLPQGIDKDGKIKKGYKNRNNLPVLNPKDIDKYAKIYKYFPNFAEAHF